MSRSMLVPIALFFCACAAARWKQTPTERIDGPRGSSFTAPPGWMFAATTDHTVLTVDGPELQAIHLTFRDKTPASAKKFDPAAPPSELAGVYIAELQTITGGRAEVLENVPATVAGKPGFRLRVRHNRHAEYAPVDMYQVYAVGHGEGLYVLSYGAFEKHLFERDRAAFEKLVRSFQLPP